MDHIIKKQNIQAVLILEAQNMQKEKCGFACKTELDMIKHPH